MVEPIRLLIPLQSSKSFLRLPSLSLQDFSIKLQTQRFPPHHFHHIIDKIKRKQNKAKLLLLTRQPTHNIKHQKDAVQRSEQSISLIFCFKGYKRCRGLFNANKRAISHFYWKVGQETFTQDFSFCKASVRK